MLVLTANVAPAAEPGGGTPIPFGFPFAGSTAQDDQALEAVAISAEREQQFGRSIARAYFAELKRQKIRVVDDGPDVEYLRKIVEVLRPFMKDADRYPSIRVHVAESRQIDARSFPGGTLVFHRGLLEFVASEAELAAIVGHELSHLAHGHQLAPLRKMELMRRTFAEPARGLSPERFFESGTSLMRLWSQPFRPQDEAAADRDGVDWAYRAGYDSRELARFFTKALERDHGPKVPMPSFFRTHPYHADRRDAVLDRFAELQKTEPGPDLYVGRENLRRRIPLSEQRFDE